MDPNHGRRSFSPNSQSYQAEENEESTINSDKATLNSATSKTLNTSSGISSDNSEMTIPSPIISTKTKKSVDLSIPISYEEPTPIQLVDRFDCEEAKLIELIEETFDDCNSLPFHCLLPSIRKVAANNPHVFHLFPNSKGMLQVRCITKKITYLNPPNCAGVKSITVEDIEWMKDTNSVLTDSPEGIKSVDASIMHVISPTLLLCSVSGPERVRILHNIINTYVEKLVRPKNLVTGRMYIIRVNNLLGRFILLSQADKSGLYYSAAVDSNYIVKHSREEMYDSLWYFHTSIHPGRLFLARIRDNAGLTEKDLPIVAEYCITSPDGCIPYLPIALFGSSERVHLIDWIHNSSWISYQMRQRTNVKKTSALDNIDDIFNKKWIPHSIDDTASNMRNTLPLYHRSLQLPDGWFVNCLSFIEQLYVNDDVDVVLYIISFAKRVMISEKKKRTLKRVDRDAYELLLKLERLHS